MCDHPCVGSPIPAPQFGCPHPSIPVGGAHISAPSPRTLHSGTLVWVSLIWGALSEHPHPATLIGAPSITAPFAHPLLGYPCVGIPIGVPPSQLPYLGALIWAPTPQTPQFVYPHPKIPTGSPLCGHPCRRSSSPSPPIWVPPSKHSSRGTHITTPIQAPLLGHPYIDTPIAHS